MRIERIRIANFKRMESCDIDLRPLDCLVGPNNSGKTTLLQALALFDFCVHVCIAPRNGSGNGKTIEIRNRNITPDEFYVLPVAAPTDLWTDKKTQAQGKHRIIEVTVSFDGGNDVTAALDLNFNLYHFSVRSENDSPEWIEKLHRFRISYLPVFSMFLPQEERRSPAVIEDALIRGRVNSVIRNLLLDLKNKDREKELTEILQRAFPALDDIEIAFDEAVDRHITVSYWERGAAKEFDVFSAGSGFQQFVYLFGFIALRDPNVILLDEPDVHLHGALQRNLLSELRRLVEAGKQVLFATHSHDLISRLEPSEILYLDEGMPRRLALSGDVHETLVELGSIEPIELFKIQQFRRVLVLENRDDFDLLETFCLKTLGNAAWREVERRLAVLFALGNPCRSDMDRLRRQLQQLVGPLDTPIRLFVVADRDYHPYPEELAAGLSAEHIEWHIWQRTEIENYLLSVPGILRIVGSRGPQMTLDAAGLQAEIERLMDAYRGSANDRLVKAFDEYGRLAKKGWDVATVSRMAREYLDEHWDDERLALVDAKEIVLPGIRCYLQQEGFGTFSDRRLAEALEPEDLPPEFHELAQRLARFAGVSS